MKRLHLNYKQRLIKRKELPVLKKKRLIKPILLGMTFKQKLMLITNWLKDYKAEEQEQFTIKQKATLFKELLEQRRKHFAAKRAEEKRNKPPTKTQQKKTMITYLKNMEGWKHKDLKYKDINSIKELFDKALKRVNMFVDFRTELVEGSSKRAGIELEQEVTKKQKVDDVQETTEVDNDQEATKIKKLIQMLKSFDRQDLEDLYKLVKAKYESTRLIEDLDLLLWNDLKDATYADLHVGRKEVSPCTIYTLTDVGKEASN
ncbi:hypothetical protein Tco_0955725 [Tanacetum coccineum]|uniref:Uncharacterized protein n=1 Tax=Tanacetum coccineum TaxID=301880 RepID=A0ABQ5E809_9ASTR